MHHCSIRCTLTPNFLYGFKLCYVSRPKKYFSANPWYRKFEEWPTLICTIITLIIGPTLFQWTISNFIFAVHGLRLSWGRRRSNAVFLKLIFLKIFTTINVGPTLAYCAEAYLYTSVYDCIGQTLAQCCPTDANLTTHSQCWLNIVMLSGKLPIV